MYLRNVLHRIVVSLLIAGCFSVHAQNSAGTVTTITPAFQTGLPADGSFDGDHENINMANGNLNVRIPLLDFPGLGGFDFRLDLIIDSKKVSLMGGSSTPDNPGGNTYEGPGWEGFPLPGNDISFAGGRLSIPAIYYTYIQIPPPDPSIPYPTDCDGGIVVVDTDGSQHAFQNIADCTENGVRYTTDETPSIDDSLDGSFMRLDTTNPDDVIAYLKNGVQYHFNLTGGAGPLATKIVDPNGNQITISQQWGVGGIVGAYQVAVTDSESRVINITNQAISYTDTNGIPQTISVSSSTDTSGPDVNFALQFCSSSLGSVDNPGPYNTDFGTYENHYTLLYPNNASYSLTYDSAGELTKIVYPTGGYTRYDYQGIAGGYSFQYFQCVADVRQVVAKHVCPSSSGTCSSENTTTYTANMGTAPGNSYTANQYIDVRDPAGNRTRYEFSASDIYGAMYGAGTKEVNRYIYSGESTLLRTIHTDYITAGGNYPVRTCSLPDLITTTLNDVNPTQQYQTAITYGTIQLTDTYYSSLLCANTAQYIDNPVSKFEYNYDGSLARYTTMSWNTQTPSAPHILDRLSSSTTSDENYDFTSTVSNTYDGAGNLLSQSKSGTGVSAVTTQYQRNAHGDVTQITDPMQNVTTLSYDSPWGDSFCPVTASGKPSSVTNSLGQVTYFKYATCTGNPVSETDANNQQTTFSYDAIGRRTAENYPDGGQDQFTYVDSVPESITTSRKMNTSGGSIVSTEILDGLGRELQTQRTSDPEGTVYVDTAYNSTGQVYSVSTPYRTTGDSTYGVTVFPLYDGLGRKESQIDSDGTSTQSWSYSGSTVTYTDEASNQWQRTSDALGRLTQVVEPGSLYTTYQYDILNNLLCADQWGTGTIGSPCASSHPRSFQYDGLSRLTFAANPEYGAVTYTYDANGNVTSKTNARGITINYSHDALNRLTWKYYFQGGSQIAAPVGFGYDGKDEDGNAMSPAPAYPIGRLTHASNEVNAAENYSYDPMGRLAQETYCTPSNCGYTNTVNASYDLAGNLSSLTYPDGRVVKQTWDGAGNLQSSIFDNWNGQSVGYPYASGLTYTPAGAQAEVTYGNGIYIHTPYDSRQQMCQLWAQIGNQPLIDRHIYFGGSTNYCGNVAGNNGNITQIQDFRNSNNTQNFGYDNLNRLTTFSSGDGSMSQTYSIDPFGNNASIAPGTLQNNLSFGANNQINSSGYGYDAAGNLTTIPDPVGGSDTFTFDAEDRITSYNNGAALYTYDANGDRVRKDFGSSWTEYLYFDGQPLVELNDDGSWSDYIFANGKRIARSDSFDQRIHIEGTSNASGSYAAWYLPFSGYVIQSGDTISWRQFQNSAVGGIGISFSDGTNTNWSTQDTDGQVMNSDNTEGSWHFRTVDLTPFAGKTATNLWITADAGTPVGSWFSYFADIAIYSTNGTVNPIYYRQTSTGLSYFGGGDESGTQAFVERGNTAADAESPWNTTTFYTADQIGSARMLSAGGGWPVSMDWYYPFGQEPIPPADNNHYKFSGKERDAETGNDYFGARYYASGLQRFMSPDWSAKEDPVPYAKLDNPQTLNLYAFLANNPVSRVDSDGHQGDPGDHVVCEGSANCHTVDDEGRVRQAQQQNGSSGGTGFWSHVSNLFHGHSWNYGMRESVTVSIVPGSEQEVEPNPYVAVGTDALGIAGAATGHPTLGYVGSAISVKNDPGVPNLVMTGMSFVPVVGEAVGAVTAVQDVGLLAGKWITNNVMAPVLNAAPPQTINDGNGHLIPNPALMDECQGLGGCN